MAQLLYTVIGGGVSASSALENSAWKWLKAQRLLGPQIYFDEFSRFGWVQWIGFPLGLAGCVGGVLMLSAREAVESLVDVATMADGESSQPYRLSHDVGARAGAGEGEEGGAAAPRERAQWGADLRRRGGPEQPREEVALRRMATRWRTRSESELSLRALGEAALKPNASPMGSLAYTAVRSVTRRRASTATERRPMSRLHSLPEGRAVADPPPDSPAAGGAGAERRGAALPHASRSAPA